jgi:hypothetical protein
MFKRTVLVAAAVLAVGWLASPAWGQGFTGTLVPGVLNQYTDQSLEHFFDVNNNGITDVGDVIVGYLRLDARTTPSPGVALGNSVVVPFSLQISAVLPGGNPLNPIQNAIISLTPTTAAGLTLATLTGDAVGANAFFAIYQGNFGDFINNPLNLTTPAMAAASIQANISGPGDLALVGAAVAASDFLNLQVTNTDFFNGTVASINTIPLGTTVGNINGGLTATVNNTGFTFDLVPASNPLTVGPDMAQLSFTGLLRGAATDPAYGIYGNPGFQNNITFTLQPQPVVVTDIPEPSSVVLMGIGLSAVAGIVWRRRKMAAAA